MELVVMLRAALGQTIRWQLSVALLAAWLAGESAAATLYVNSAHHKGGDGSTRFRTIAEALKSISPGDRLIIEPGVYRESLDLTNTRLKNGQSSRPTIIEGAAEGAVVIKGSDVVTSWDELKGGRFVKRAWNINSQQVFIDGTSLQQIGGTIAYPADKWKGRVAGDVNSMPAGSFYYDEAAGDLYVRPEGGNLTGKTVEVSVRSQLVQAYGVDGYTLKNLMFTHSNSTAVGQAGALRMIGNNITVDRIKVADCDGVGITLRGDNNVIKDSVFTRCGQFGVTGSGRNVKIMDNEISHNNTRGFDKWWGAGGTKFMASSPLGGVEGLHDSEFVRNRVVFNKGDGIWMDSDNRNVLIKDNIAAYNDGSGIHYEISYAGRIVDNFSFGNTQRGIYVANSADTVVEHNLVARNGLEGIYAQNAESRARKYPARNNKVMGNIIAWSGKHAVRLPDTGYNNVSDSNLIVGTGPQYGIWDDASNPTVTGLVAWQERFSQDRKSWEKRAPLPADLASKLKNEELNIDWAALRALASGVESSTLKRRPGPPR